MWSLQSNRSRNQAADELYSTDHHNVADGIDGAAEGLCWRSAPAVPAAWSAAPWRPRSANPCRSRPVADDRRDGSIRNSSAGIRRPRRPASAICSLRPMGEKCVRPPLRPGGERDRSRPIDPTHRNDDGSAQNGQDRKLAFVNASVDRRTVSPDRVTRPASPYIVQAGTVIPGALITGIRSDLPGPDHGAGDRKCFRHARPVAFCSSRRERA